jgi:hydrogenase nickel incorporation protein HypA/HybF
MHEVSLVRSIFNSLEAEFDPEELGRLEAIDLRVGQLSNVEPVLMQNAFQAVKDADNRYEGVRLNVEVLPIIVECHLCGSKSQIRNYRFICSNCNTPTSQVIQGNELLIHRVHFHDPVAQ